MSSQADSRENESQINKTTESQTMSVPSSGAGGKTNVSVEKQPSTEPEHSNMNSQSEGIKEVHVQGTDGANESLKVPESMKAPVSDENAKEELQATKPVKDGIAKSKYDRDLLLEKNDRLVSFCKKYIPGLKSEQIDLGLRWKEIFIQYSSDSRLVFLTGFLSFLFGYLRFGFLSLFVVMTICIQYHRISTRRVRMSFRDDYTRYLAVRRLESNPESVSWLNAFLQQFWYIFEPTLSSTVIEIADQVLSENVPNFLDSMVLSTFTLGTKSPRIEYVRSYPKTEEDVIMMDWKVSFVPEDLSDLTGREIASRVNPKIALDIKIGKSVASAKMPVLVENISFSGHLRVKVKLIDEFPHAKTVGITFVEKPAFSYVLKPIGGDKLGFDINNIPGLTSFINDQVHDNLGPMMYSPNVFELDIQSMVGSSNLKVAIGAVEIRLRRCESLKGDVLGSIDPYVVIKNSFGKKIGISKTVQNTTSPTFNETFYAIINSFAENLILEVYDFNDLRKDKLIGTATVALSVLEAMPAFNDVKAPITLSNKERGTLIFDSKFYPTIDVGEEDSAKIEGPGIVQFTAHQCKDLSKDPSKRHTAYANLVINDKIMHTTRKIKKNNNPSWEEFCGTVVPKGEKGMVGIQVFTDENSRPAGTVNMSLQELVTATQKGLGWFQFPTATGGRVRLSATWKPVELSVGDPGSLAVAVPIGVMRIHINSCSSLHSKLPGKKCDAYVRALSYSMEQGRTVVIKDSLNPSWDEHVYVPVMTKHDTCQLQVMQYESHGDDTVIGTLSVPVSKFVHQSENGTFLEYHEPSELTNNLISSRGVQGKSTIKYRYDFYPLASVPGLAPKEPSSVITPPAVDAGEETSGVQPEAEKDSLAKKQPTLPSQLLSPPEVTNECLKYESGFMSWDVISSQLSGKYKLAIFLDDLPHHVYMSPVLNGPNGNGIHEFGRTFIRQLQFSQCSFKLLDGTKVVSSQICSTKKLITEGSSKLFRLSFDKGGSFLIAFRFTPVVLKLDEKEKYENMGKMTVDVLNATDLASADSNGKSDPFVIFELQDEEVFRTKIIKKNLNPVFNEGFEVELPCKQTSKFVARVFDSDFGNQNDPLGSCVIDLYKLQQHEYTSFELPLDSNQGTLNLRIHLEPRWVLRSKRAGNSSFAEDLLGQTAQLMAMPLEGISSLGEAAFGGINAAVDGVTSVANLTNKMRKGFSRGLKKDK
ncbi:tricalbin, C2 domain protein (phospholipid binding) ER-plasma membrane tethering protein Tcb3 [Schizosaccharomyces osmophilus]|uniref:Tricalbin, C2 domain protein (Phospholipid binding) ER-plasma membrane tethering protein Tcb3 n=1 Tax=Schizosaccharomyces osmophilus TaxID=2545709 RepID=A0AAE9W6P3_9SCHI|nr:tricalbin, C2 domain protein (phospholipid binding) ER-plasma membrane tethering protein Tcb3 [Schizosaccharomyces osmophilus]WBW70554.1 tricalbin, C2 domain protein (phospholipid binding) ER-plasma membrane tethering protein Tcb3 [Schizosaccharomyces osmophilus]